MSWFTVAAGNAFDGHTLYGPFSNMDDAIAFADDALDQWIVIELETPEYLLLEEKE